LSPPHPLQGIYPLIGADGKMAFEFRGAIIVSLLAKDKQRPARRRYIKPLQAALVLESWRSAAAYVDCSFE